MPVTLESCDDATQTTCVDDSFSYLDIGYHASFVNVDASIPFWHRHVNPRCEFCERVPANSRGVRHLGIPKHPRD